MPLEPLELGRVDYLRVEHLSGVSKAQRLVQTQPEHHPLRPPDGDGKLLDLAGRRFPAGQRGYVPRQRWRVPPASALDCADCADPDAEVVAALPVGEVVLRPQVAAAGPAGLEAEVRRLVPAVAGARQRVDDPFDVPLHRLGLPLQLHAVVVGETGARLRLELVRRKVLRLERKGIVEIGLEVGGLLARDAVDEIERDVVNSGIT